MPGIHRLRRYTLENYLLEPEGWFDFVRVTRGALPAGWDSAVEVAQRLDEAYRGCLELAARNLTVFDERCRHRVDGIEFREHPDALAKLNPRDELAGWGRNRGTPRPLVDVFEDHLARLQASERSVWHREVTGKAVLKVFLKKLKLALKSPMQDKVCCSWYITVRPQPHQDLVDIVDAILEAALVR